jgi:hypothetical protein
MPVLSQIIADYIEVYRSGRCDDAFHCLIDYGAQLVPDLIYAYEATDCTDTKVFLLEVVSYFRCPDASGFLRHALRRSESAIWKQALDGLVQLRAAEDLERVLASTLDEPKRSWIVEAISQCRDDCP